MMLLLRRCLLWLRLRLWLQLRLWLRLRLRRIPSLPLRVLLLLHPRRRQSRAKLLRLQRRLVLAPAGSQRSAPPLPNRVSGSPGGLQPSEASLLARRPRRCRHRRRCRLRCRRYRCRRRRRERGAGECASGRRPACPPAGACLRRAGRLVRRTSDRDAPVQRRGGSAPLRLQRRRGRGRGPRCTRRRPPPTPPARSWPQPSC
mmetsp:Transcript_2480/g.7145  ORF Transcript_2480/g.7145 Transcript_2480/m.7145 type:complete len:202 (+) Transcript_2480:715-1320(+)